MVRFHRRRETKKLTGIADHLFGSDAITDADAKEIDEQAAIFGIETLDTDELKTPPYEVWKDHISALNTFLRCVTQWRTGTSGVVGLDYNVVLQVMVLYDVPNRPAVLDEVRVIEDRAVALLNKKTKV